MKYDQGESGCILPAGTVFIRPVDYALIGALLEDAVIRHRRAGIPDRIHGLVRDLKRLAAEIESPEPALPASAATKWLSTQDAAAEFVAAGFPLSVRQVRAMAQTGKLLSRRTGHRREIALEAVAEEVAARVWLSRQSRQSPGSREFGDSAALETEQDHALEEAS